MEHLIARRPARRSPVTLAILLCLAAAPAWAADFVIGFDPDDGSVWTRTTEDRRLQDFKSLGDRTDQRTRILMDQRYEAQPDGSWLVVQDVLEVTMTKNDEILDNPMLPIIEDQETRVVLDANGHAVDAEGFRALMRRYERELSPEFFQEVREQMKVENLSAGEVSRWNRSLEGLYGLELAPGDRVAVTEARAEVQGNVIEVTGVIEVGDWVEVGGGRGVSMVYRYDNTGEALAAAGETRHEIERRAGEETSTLRVPVAMSGTVEFVVVPATGQLLSEDHVQVSRATFPEAPNEPVILQVESHSTWVRAEGAGS